MAKRSSILWIILGLIVLLGIWLGSSYNGFLTARAGVDNSWADVQTQYQRRFDLIPNLTSTVRGAADFEQETFTSVTQARSQWQSAGSREAQIAAAEEFDTALSRLLVTVEAYPQLQATQAFRDLMTQLEGTENRISTARRDYNGTVQTYNLKVSRFPGNLLAGMFGFGPETYFESAEGADEAPKVDFDQ